MELKRKHLTIKALATRQHDLTLRAILDLRETPISESAIHDVAQRIQQAKEHKRPVIVMIGAHVIRDGVQRYLIDLMERGFISCLAMNGAGMIHDFEFALIGATTESVAKYIKTGEFGLWRESGELNDIISQGYHKHLGMGEAVGRHILERELPYRDLSLLATGYRLQIPITVHVGIGYDIIHEHPNCDGAATGATSYRDFLRFAHIVEKLEGGVVMNFGSAIMAPEVYLKALSMARNLAHQGNREIKHFSTVVCDLHDLPDNFRETPPKENPAYYFRPWKTMLVRTVADGGESFYIQGRHAETIPALWSALQKT